MFGLIIPVAVGVAGLTGVAIYRKRKQGLKGKMTPDRERVYVQALNKLTDPQKLKELAQSFYKEGLKPYGDMLMKRARLRELPKDVKKARHAAFKKAMLSTDKKAILEMAAVYEKEGATGSATQLRKRAAGLA
jgi:hypothetical protein